MKKSKGFTLIELLAVIIILAIILAIAVPNITKVIDNARYSAFKSSENLFAKTSQTYLTSYSNLLPVNINDTSKIYLNDLITAKYIDNIKDPISNNNCNPNLSYVLVTKTSENTYTYKSALVCDSFISLDTLNLLNDIGNFEKDSNDNGEADGWHCSCHATVFAVSNSEKYLGDYSQKCSLSASPAGSTVCINTTSFFNPGIIDRTHKYYTRIYYKKTNGSGYAAINIHNATRSFPNMTSDTSKPINQWQTYSTIINMANDSRNQNSDSYSLFVYTNQDGSTTADTYVDDIVILDLTAIYGAGNEPSTTTIDNIIRNVQR